MVTLHRVLRTLNLLVAGAFLAAAGAGYWYLWRSLPETRGRLTAPVRGAVTIARDDLGRPHIAAQDELDALFAQGFATAQDRMWQMDTARRRWRWTRGRGGCGCGASPRPRRTKSTTTSGPGWRPTRGA